MIKIYFVNIRTQLLSEVFMVLKLYATLLMYTNIDMLAREIPRDQNPFLETNTKTKTKQSRAYQI